MTTGNSLSTSMTWNAALNPTSQTGANSDQTTTLYDSAGRQQSVTSPFGGNTTYAYNYGASPASVQSTANNKVVTTYLDGLGRPNKTQTGDNQGGLQSIVETVYDACGCTPMGKPQKISLPHAPGANPLWKTYTYDAIGRTLTMIAPDGASTTTYSYAGNTVTVTDPAGKWKRYVSDAFGRLVQVTEPSPNSPAEPNHVTLYSYGVLDRLLQVRMDRTVNGQVKTQYRTWTYDPSTQLLTSQTAPETGTTSFSYNSDSTLATVIDAKGHQKVYSYDTYGRVVQISRGSLLNGQFNEDPTQRTTFTYDGSNNGFSANTAGRVSLVNYSGPHGLQFAELYSYHAAGAITAKRLSVSGTALGSNAANLDGGYSYDNFGNTTAVQYPFAQWSNGTVVSSGPQYSYTYDTQFRPSHLSGPNNQTLVNSVSYGYAGEMLQMNAASFTETRTYNANLQLTELISGANLHARYNYSTTQNNGRITSQTDVISGETVTYAYDSLNRLVNASGTGDPSGAWSQAFTYDGFGNLTQKVGAYAPNNTLLTADPLTNRLTGNGAVYDNNGNLSAYGTGSFAVSYAYDNENRLSVSYAGGNSQTVFGYDQSNQRIYQGTYNTVTSTYSNEQLYFYGADGKKLAAYSLQISGSNTTLAASQTKIWFAGRLLAPQDRLQSQGKYFPYGEDRYSPNPANPANDQEKFATYTRDSATGLDYAYQRYYNSQTGRFMTADPYAGSALLGAPQSANRYSYTINDPANVNDPQGLEGDVGPPPCFPPYCSPYPTAIPGKGPRPNQPPLTVDVTGLLVKGETEIIKQATMAATDKLFDPNCAGLFLSPGDNTPAARKQLSQQLQSMSSAGDIRLIQASAVPNYNPAISAFTTGQAGLTFVVFKGPFFSGTLNGNPLGGAMSGLSISNQEDLTIIHEFMHWEGIVGPDNNNQQYTLPNGDKVKGSDGISAEVRKKCFS